MVMGLYNAAEGQSVQQAAFAKIVGLYFELSLGSSASRASCQAWGGKQVTLQKRISLYLEYVTPVLNPDTSTGGQVYPV